MAEKAALILPVTELSAEWRAQWRAYAANAPVQASPFLTLDFAEAVAQVRPDLRVGVVLGRDGQADGFLAFHRRPGGLLRPAAAPVSDWQGPILRPGATVDMATLVAACGGDVMRFAGISPIAEHFAKQAEAPVRSWYIDLKDGVEAYRARLKAQEGKSLANAARCARKVEREIGPLRLNYQEPDATAFRTVIDWKRERFNTTGKHDIFKAGWIYRLFWALYRWPRADFGLVFTTLYFGDRLAAGEIYLRSGGNLHAWISSYDRELLSYGPGHILTDMILNAASRAGVKRIDFGQGNDEYKSKWCLDFDPIAEAVVYARTPLGVMRGAAFERWRKASPALGGANDILRRVRGRADHVFATHSNWMGAASALAVTMVGRRQGIS
jgi:CelD/BcsL family acetyltransferase involved in cellulose biosynthesis